MAKRYGFRATKKCIVTVCDQVLASSIQKGFFTMCKRLSKVKARRFPYLLVAWVLVICAFLGSTAQSRVIEDMAGRRIKVPEEVDKVYCSGPGCLRLLTYLQAQDLAVAVDDLEKREQPMEARPYALAHPELKDLALGGGFRGRDNPELLLSLDQQPQVIFKTFPRMGLDAETLQKKTGIPVVALHYGDLGKNRSLIYESLKLMAKVLDCRSRAEEVVRFFEAQIQELRDRSENIPQDQQPTVFVGGVAFKGPHGFQSTEPGYPAFRFVPARNLAARSAPSGQELRHSIVAKEQIMIWDPDVLFLDLATLQMGQGAGGLHELRDDPAYQALSAVQEGRVFGLLPYNWYATNFGSVLANAYFIGSVLYPERFADIHIQERADAVFSFLVGEEVLKRLNRALSGMVFDQVKVN
jgi:iron complex transport system substrate-binding protein